MPPSLKETVETILVVDDDDLMIEVVVSILEAENFRVFSANAGPAALKFASETSASIDLLLSDVDMRQVTGPELGEVLQQSRPEMHVMLMSGGSSGDLPVLPHGWAYIQKPFVPGTLVQMVKEVLHTKNRSPSGEQAFERRKGSRQPV